MSSSSDLSPWNYNDCQIKTNRFGFIANTSLVLWTEVGKLLQEKLLGLGFNESIAKRVIS